MDTKRGLRELSLFTGAGGGLLGGMLLDWRTVCAVEIEPYACGVLIARQNEGILPPFPIWDDVRTFDGRPWRGLVDIISGGFPCQDISCAGKGAGITGERSGLWKEFARIIREVRPRYAFVENSPLLTKRGIDVVLGDLASLGYNAEWGVLGASDVAPRTLEKEFGSLQDRGMWPTIAGNYNRKGLSKTSGDGLETAVKMWPTPRSTDGTHGGRVTPRKARNGGNLIEAVSVSSPDIGSLNPTWVEWLMGWPPGWTDLKPLVTDKCHNALRRLGTL